MGRSLAVDPRLSASWALAWGRWKAVFYRMDRMTPVEPPRFGRKMRPFRRYFATSAKACKTAWVESSPVDPLLEPISPELVLVDPELAELARALLPLPRERAIPPRPRLEAAPRPVAHVARRPPTRRWRRTVVLAALVFTAGAFSGGYLGREQGALTQMLPRAQEDPPSPDEQPSEARPPAGKERPTLRNRRPGGTAVAQRRSAPAIWAPNVLGVTAAVDADGVSLTWQPPAGSDHVVVSRALDGKRHSVVVFRGGATSYRDVTARSCTAYRYTIVNIDPRGHRSTGVPTTVVTGGCT